LVVPCAPPAVEEGELSIEPLRGTAIGAAAGAFIGAPVVPVCPLERGWFGAPDCSAPEFIDPGFVLPGGGLFCADAKETARTLANPTSAILNFMTSTSFFENSTAGSFMKNSHLSANSPPVEKFLKLVPEVRRRNAMGT